MKERERGGINEKSCNVGLCGWYLTRYNDKNLTWERERGGINEKSCNVGLCGWYLTRHNNSFHHERERGERERL